MGSSVKHAFEIESAGRLALGACEGACLNAARGVVVEHVGQNTHGTAHVAHEHTRCLDAIESLLGKIAECPRRKGLLQVLALERTTLAHKERAGHNLARVGRDEVDQGLLAALGQPHLVQNARSSQRLGVDGEGDTGLMGCLHVQRAPKSDRPRAQNRQGAGQTNRIHERRALLDAASTASEQSPPYACRL